MGESAKDAAKDAAKDTSKDISKDAATGAATDPDSDGEADALYRRLGGDAGLRALVDRFYDLMDLDPAFADLRSLHPASLDGSRDKLHWFLSGWTGGPPLYEQRHGHPRLRARHLPYRIGIAQRDQWMLCMIRA